MFQFYSITIAPSAVDTPVLGWFLQKYFDSRIITDETQYNYYFDFLGDIFQRHVQEIATCGFKACAV